MGEVRELVQPDRRELVAGLERLLVRARTGEIVTVAYVTQPKVPTDPVSTGVIGDPDECDVPQVTYALQGLLHRIYQSEFVDEDDDE